MLVSHDSPVTVVPTEKPEIRTQMVEMSLEVLTGLQHITDRQQM